MSCCLPSLLLPGATQERRVQRRKREDEEVVLLSCSGHPVLGNVLKARNSSFSAHHDLAALQKSLLCVYMCQQTQGWIAAGLNLEDCMERNDQKVCNSCFIWGIHWLQGKSIRREEISSFWGASNTFTIEISFQRHYYSTRMERTETWEGYNVRHWGLRKLFKLRPRKGWCGRERTSDDEAEEEVRATVQGTTVAKLQSLSFILKVIGSFLKGDKGRAWSSFYSCGHLDYLCSGELQVR